MYTYIVYVFLMCVCVCSSDSDSQKETGHVDYSCKNLIAASKRKLGIDVMWASDLDLNGTF